MQLAMLPGSMRPLRRVEYDRLVDLGVFEGERIELLRGVLVRMSPQGVVHASTIQRMTHLLVLSLGASGRAAIRVQLPLALADDSEPEPDLAIVAPGDYSDHHPSRALVVIEVADSSLAIDRGEKAELYASAGIPEYWLVDVGRRLIEVHTDVVDGVYTRIVPYSRGDAISPRAFPDVALRVDAILLRHPSSPVALLAADDLASRRRALLQRGRPEPYRTMQRGEWEPRRSRRAAPSAQRQVSSADPRRRPS